MQGVEGATASGVSSDGNAAVELLWPTLLAETLVKTSWSAVMRAFGPCVRAAAVVPYRSRPRTLPKAVRAGGAGGRYVSDL